MNDYFSEACLRVTIELTAEEVARLNQLTRLSHGNDIEPITEGVLRSALGLRHPACSDGERTETIRQVLLRTKWAPPIAEAVVIAPLPRCPRKTRVDLPATLYRRSRSRARDRGLTFSENALRAIQREIREGALSKPKGALR